METKVLGILFSSYDAQKGRECECNVVDADSSPRYSLQASSDEPWYRYAVMDVIWGDSHPSQTVAKSVQKKMCQRPITRVGEHGPCMLQEYLVT